MYPGHLHPPLMPLSNSPPVTPFSILVLCAFFINNPSFTGAAHVHMVYSRPPQHAQPTCSHIRKEEKLYPSAASNCK